MLHLALAGNVLSALGGSLDLYDPRVVHAAIPWPHFIGRYPNEFEASHE